MKNLTRKQRKNLIRIIAAAVLLIAVKILTAAVPVPAGIVWALYLLPYAVIGWAILWKALSAPGSMPRRCLSCFSTR